MTSTADKRTCSTCRLELPLSCFSLNIRRALGVSYNCKPCSRAYANAYRAKNVIKFRERRVRAYARAKIENPNYKKMATESHRKMKYGVTPETVAKMAEEQDFSCGICAVKFKDDNYHLDHNHENGRVRGLLCNKCNLGIGLLGDNAQRVLAAAHYLDGASR